jgi:hypothetical protein
MDSGNEAERIRSRVDLHLSRPAEDPKERGFASPPGPDRRVDVRECRTRIFLDLVPSSRPGGSTQARYIDAIDGGRIDWVLVEPGDVVQQGQPMIELSNTNLSLQVIQQASQLNQAISQLQQNQISLERNRLSDDRALADIEYHILRLECSARTHSNNAM